LLSAAVSAQSPSETYATDGVLLSEKNGLDNLFYNPARLSFSGFQFKLGGLGVTFDNKNRDLFKFIDDNKNDFENWSEVPAEKRAEIIDDMMALDSRHTMVNLAPAVGMAFKGFAVGAFATSYLDIDLQPPDNDLACVRLDARHRTEAVMAAGISNRLTSRLSIGANFKYINIWDNEAADMSWSRAGDLASWIELLYKDKHNLVSGYSAGAGACFWLTGSALIEYMADDVFFDVDGYERDPHGRIQASLQLGRTILNNITGTRRILIGGSVASDDNLLPSFGSENYHAGLQLEYPLLRLRGGLGKDRYSYGAGLDLGFIELMYACRVTEDSERYHTLATAVVF
jgi:hypothetical protein